MVQICFGPTHAPPRAHTHAHTPTCTHQRAHAHTHTPTSPTRTYGIDTFGIRITEILVISIPIKADTEATEAAAHAHDTTHTHAPRSCSVFCIFAIHLRNR